MTQVGETRADWLALAARHELRYPGEGAAEALEEHDRIRAGREPVLTRADVEAIAVTLDTVKDIARALPGEEEPPCGPEFPPMCRCAPAPYVAPAPDSLGAHIAETRAELAELGRKARESLAAVLSIPADALQRKAEREEPKPRAFDPQPPERGSLGAKLIRMRAEHYPVAEIARLLQMEEGAAVAYLTVRAAHTPAGALHYLREHDL